MKSSRPTVSIPASKRPRRVVTGLLVACALLFAGAARAETFRDEIRMLHERLSSWDLAGVEAWLPGLLERHPDAPEVRLVQARLRLLQRDFEGAGAALDGFCHEDASDAVEELCEVTASSAEITRDFATYTSSQGHFVIHYQPGLDEILLPYADETLEAAYRELGELFRFRPTRPVHVDILPTVTDLARMTPLTEEEIRTSGTIAMCKYNRMMVVSPRDLVYGYPWRDTLGHEYIHFLLTMRSHNRVPLWLHEGLAKVFEARWRSDAPPRLKPFSEHVLAQGVKQRRLVSFRKMMPSFGKLPSQDHTALAFAQVFTLVDWLVAREGNQGMLELLDRLTAGEQADAALKAVYGGSFRWLERRWRRWLHKQRWAQLPKAHRPRLLFRGTDRKEDELESIEEERGRDLTYLGDLLRARGRFEAALNEYEKAVTVSGTASPVIQSKMAAALLELGYFEDVLANLADVLKSYPSYVLLHLYQGEALLRLGRTHEAVLALRAANALNPFDRDLHGLLAEALDAAGKPEQAAFERRQQALLTQY